MKKLLFVITTHDKYLKNGMLDRCINSIRCNFDPNLYDILIEFDSKPEGGNYFFKEENNIVGAKYNHHFGVTQSRLAGYIYAHKHDYEWVSFVDADAYFKLKPNLGTHLDDPSCGFISCRYGFHKKDDTDFIVDTYEAGTYRADSTCERLFSLGAYRDYPIFMGRFMRTKLISADMFVDSKMIGDDGIFFFNYLNEIFKQVFNCEKIEGLIVTDEEDNKALPLLNINVGVQMLKWTVNNIQCSEQFEPALSEFIFKHLIMGRLAYTYHRNKEITEQDITNTINDIPNRFDEHYLEPSQVDFLDLVRSSSVLVTKFMKDRYD